MPKALVKFLQLPIPGQTLAENREIKVEEYTMQIYSHLLPDLKLTQLLSTHKVTMPMLKDRLASYGCPTSGSRSQLVQRLRDFAADKDNWVRWVIGHSRHHWQLLTESKASFKPMSNGNGVTSRELV